MHRFFYYISNEILLSYYILLVSYINSIIKFFNITETMENIYLYLYCTEWLEWKLQFFLCVIFFRYSVSYYESLIFMLRLTSFRSTASTWTWNKLTYYHWKWVMSLPFGLTAFWSKHAPDCPQAWSSVCA